jgi:hypothetical protein
MKYELQLKRRLVIYRILIAMLLISIFLIGALSDRGILLDSRYMSMSAQQVSRLIVFGGIIILLILHHRAARLLQNKVERNEKHIRESDERQIFINDKSNTLTLKLLVGVGIIALLILSYVDMTAFSTAYGIMIAGLLLKGITYLYYKNKVG